MVIKANILILLAALLRLFTQLYGNDFWYFTGRDIFDLTALFFVWGYVTGWLRKFIAFCCGLAFWGLIKTLFLNPEINDPYEIMGVYFGLVFLLFQLLYDNGTKRT